MIGICPSCGTMLKGEKGASDEVMKLCSVCNNPDAMPTGIRFMPDQASLVFTDGKMIEYKREDYEKTYGFDPLPVWRTIIGDQDVRDGR